MPVCWKLQIRREIPCTAGLVPSSRRCKNNQNKCQTPAPWPRPRPSGTGILPGHPCLLEQRGRAKRICCMAGRAGSSHHQQRKTERSRRGTPCYTYRYRMWIFAGCVRQGAPCFFFVIYPMYQTAYSYGRNNSSLPCHDLTLSVGEPDNAAAQTGAGTSFGATGAPLT